MIAISRRQAAHTLAEQGHPLDDIAPALDRLKPVAHYSGTAYYDPRAVYRLAGKRRTIA